MRYLFLACLALAACDTPLERQLDATIAACRAGSRGACAELPMLMQAEDIALRRQQRDIAAMNAIGAAAQAGGRIAPAWQPVPVAPVQSRASCQITGLGGGAAVGSCW